MDDIDHADMMAETADAEREFHKDEAEAKGVVGLANRELLTLSQLDEFVAEETRVGAFVAFVTDEDAHSPLMLPVYDKLVEAFENIIPLKVVQVFSAADDRHDEQLAHRFLVTAAPTLVWYNFGDHGQPLLYMRIVGTVLLGKLEKEVNDKLDEVLA